MTAPKPRDDSPSLRTLLLTAAAMVAFAANSVLCRLALDAGLIDAAGFAAVRTIAGAVTLGVILGIRSGPRRERPNWRAAAMLYVYMVFFSFAYLSLGAGTGALVLFASVQLTMFVVALRSGETFPLLSWFGLLLAATGLVVLIAPGVTAPDPAGTLLMVIAGIAWGVYSLLGRSAVEPVAATAYNFIYAVPAVLLTAAVFAARLHATFAGVAYAVISGALASGIGYVLWYAALRGLTATSAATVQLSVPVIAAIGGVLLLAEDLTLRLALASIATLGGVGIVLAGRRTQPGSS